jgi:DNA mismatch endonuclease, patch repair protein
MAPEFICFHPRKNEMHCRVIVRKQQSEMTDTLTPEQRSRAMRAVRAQDTAPELRIRRHLHRRGFRYRVHRSDLPGTPDIVFVSLRKVINIHGCFWHGHSCKKGALPKTRASFWSAKIRRNRERDAASLESLSGKGWQALVIWECELRDFGKVEARLKKFLN